MALKLTPYDSAHEYAKEGRIDALKELLIKHMEEDDTFIDHFHKKSDSTILTTACGEGQYDVVMMLLELDVKVDIPNGKGNTPLIEAASHGYVGKDG
jgi:ankyrin repeat protein